MTMGSWQERVRKMLYGHATNPNAELAMREKAEDFLIRAYSGEPTVTFWLDAHGYTTDDLEAEISRLSRAIEGKKVGPPIIDLARMEREVAEKQGVLGRLIALESVLEPALEEKGWALEKMLELGFTSVRGLEEEVMRLSREVLDPPRVVEWVPAKGLPSQGIEPLTLRNHTIENITSLAAYIQTEGSIGFAHVRRHWAPSVGLGMAYEEPIRYTGRLVSRIPTFFRVDGRQWGWRVRHTAGLRLLRLMEPYLMADKKESARYVLNIGRSVPDTEYVPMYIGFVERAFRAVFLYPEYVDFPARYAIVVRKGDVLPRPIKPRVVRYTVQGGPIYWEEGMVKD